MSAAGGPGAVPGAVDARSGFEDCVEEVVGLWSRGVSKGEVEGHARRLVEDGSVAPADLPDFAFDLNFEFATRCYGQRWVEWRFAGESGLRLKDVTQKMGSLLADLPAVLCTLKAGQDGPDGAFVCAVCGVPAFTAKASTLVLPTFGDDEAGRTVSQYQSCCTCEARFRARGKPLVKRGTPARPGDAPDNKAYAQLAVDVNKQSAALRRRCEMVNEDLGRVVPG